MSFLEYVVLHKMRYQVGSKSHLSASPCIENGYFCHKIGVFTTISLNL